MVRNICLGNWCGYVGVPPGHPLHAVGYSQPCEALRGVLAGVMDGTIGNRGIITLVLAATKDGPEPTPEFVFDVHGSLTFAGPCSATEDPARGICHTPEPGRSEDVWWLGFDCAHSGDLSPYSAARSPSFMSGDEIYRDLAYVEAEVLSLATQFSALARKLAKEEG